MHYRPDDDDNPPRNPAYHGFAFELVVAIICGLILTDVVLALLGALQFLAGKVF